MSSPAFHLSSSIVNEFKKSCSFHNILSMSTSVHSNITNVQRVKSINAKCSILATSAYTILVSTKELLLSYLCIIVTEARYKEKKRESIDHPWTQGSVNVVFEYLNVGSIPVHQSIFHPKERLKFLSHRKPV